MGYQTQEYDDESGEFVASDEDEDDAEDDFDDVAFDEEAEEAFEGSDEY